MKALVIAIALLFITNSSYSQKVLNSVAGRDYRFYGFNQNYYRVDKIDSLLIISDDMNTQYEYCSSMIFSLNNLKFLKRTELLFSSRETLGHLTYLGYSKNNGGEFWYAELNKSNQSLIFKQKIYNGNNNYAKQIINLKDSLFEVGNKNVKEALLIRDTLYLISKNSKDINDTNYYLTAWNTTNNSRINSFAKYFNKSKKLPIKYLIENYYLIEKGKIYNEFKNKSIDIFEEIKKYDKNIVRTNQTDDNNINCLAKTKTFIAFYPNFAYIYDNKSFYSHMTFIIDSNLNIRRHLLSMNIIRGDSYNENNQNIYFIDTSYNLSVFNVQTLQTVETINLSNYLSNSKTKDIFNITVINDSILLFTLKNETTFSGIHSSFLFNYKSKTVFSNLYNDLYQVQNISISKNDKFIAVIGKNKKLFIYDSNFVEKSYYDFSENEDISYYDTTLYNSEMNYNVGVNKILVTAGNLFKYNVLIDLLTFNIENVFTKSENSFTSSWNNNNKYLAMNNKSNQVDLYNANGKYQLIRKLELPLNYKIIKIYFKTDDTLSILVKDTLSMNDVIVNWNCPTYDYSMQDLKRNIFRVNSANTNHSVKVSKDNSTIYQDYDGKYISLNTHTYEIKEIRIADNKSGYFPQTNYSELSNNKRYLIFSSQYLEKHEITDSYLTLMDLKNNINLDNINKIVSYNDKTYFRTLKDIYYSTKQFCNYAQFNNNPNKIICGSFDGTLSILEFENLLTSVETENINSLDKTCKVFVNSKSYEFKNTEPNPVKISIYNFNGNCISKIVLESDELIDLANYSNNEKMLMIQRENSLTGEVIDNKILIFQ